MTVWGDIRQCGRVVWLVAKHAFRRKLAKGMAWEPPEVAAQHPHRKRYHPPAHMTECAASRSLIVGHPERDESGGAVAWMFAPILLVVLAVVVTWIGIILLGKGQ